MIHSLPSQIGGDLDAPGWQSHFPINNISAWNFLSLPTLWQHETPPPRLHAREAFYPAQIVLIAAQAHPLSKSNWGAHARSLTGPLTSPFKPRKGLASRTKECFVASAGHGTMPSALPRYMPGVRVVGAGGGAGSLDFKTQLHESEAFRIHFDKTRKVWGELRWSSPGVRRALGTAESCSLGPTGGMYEEQQLLGEVWDSP